MRDYIKFIFLIGGTLMAQTIISVKLLPGKPIVVPGCKVRIAGGYWERENGNRHLSNEEIGRDVRQNLKAGMIGTIYPDEDGVFVTNECQKR